jgi:hypothetical protein
MAKFICVPCALPAEAAGDCKRCGDVLLDTSREDVRQLITDIDDRQRRVREQRLTWVAIAAGFVVVAGLWSIPGFWEARKQFFALPMLVDQLLLITFVSYGLLQLTKRFFPARSRFDIEPQR